MIGYIIPEVILAVFSFGIGTVVKNGAKAISKALQIIFQVLGKAVRATVKILKAGIGFLDDAVKAIRAMAKLFLKKGNKQVSAFFEKLEELFNKFKEFLKRNLRMQMIYCRMIKTNCRITMRKSLRIQKI